MEFAALTKLYFNYDTSHGLLDGHFYFGGKNDDPRTLYGKGAVEVTEGNVFAIPVLGPFSSILNSIVPGMGYNMAHDGTSTFTLEDGVISTHDFLVKGKGFSMIGDGRLLFLDDRLNFNIRLNAQGLPGVLLFPVSKLLEYRGRARSRNRIGSRCSSRGAGRSQEIRMRGRPSPGRAKGPNISQPSEEEEGTRGGTAGGRANYCQEIACSPGASWTGRTWVGVGE